MARPLPSLEMVRERLSYDPETGIFRWLVKPRHRALKNGDIAGCVDSLGYIAMGIAGCEIRAHRLAWFYVYGVWPQGVIDHINGNKADNRIANLRDVNQHINQHNRHAPSRSKYGAGVGLSRRNRFVAQITVKGRNLHLGTFDTVDEATAARRAAERQVFASAAIQQPPKPE